MPMFNPNIHHRRSIRLNGYDYSKEGLYFITLCCQDRICRFGRVENGEMILNEYGQIAHNEWLKTPEIRNNVELGAFVIMPNHMHAIIRFTRRGELHSPQLTNEKQTPPTIRDELHSPQLTNESQTPPTVRGELHSPPTERDEFDSHSNNHDPSSYVHFRGEFNSPLRSPSQTVGAVVRGYKSSVTKKLGLLGFTGKLWQRNYFERIIRDEKSFHTISNYILNNPLKWKGDKFYIQ